MNQKPPNNDFSTRNGNNSSKDPPSPWSRSPKQELWLHPTPSELPAKHSSSTPGSDWMHCNFAVTLVWVFLPLPKVSHSHPVLSTHTGFPFFPTTLLPTFFDWRRDLRTPRSTQKHSEQQRRSLVGEESLSHQRAFPISWLQRSLHLFHQLGGRVGPFITASILSPFRSSGQKQTSPRRGWDGK